MVAVVQSSPRFGERERNLAELERQTAELRADLVVLPELASTGYRFVSREEAAALAEPARDDAPTIACYRAIAQRTGATVVGGFAERGADGRIYNSAAIVYPSGLLAVYRKVHLFGDEPRWFEPGADLPPVIHTPSGLRVGVMICFDWLFPEPARHLALEGADLIAHPANLVLPWCPDLMPLRALENGVFVATANRIGAERRSPQQQPLRFLGRSQILAPDGTRRAALGPERTGLARAEIDPEQARSPRAGAAGAIRAQRRDELWPWRPRPGPGEPPRRRWALVRHETPEAAQAHCDLFLERGGRLLSWRGSGPLADGSVWRRQFCHRRRYLAFEGELSG
ncbi:MAG: hypothetical protein D6776_01210, partial [Planctomycetota bacterium]